MVFCLVVGGGGGGTLYTLSGPTTKKTCLSSHSEHRFEVRKDNKRETMYLNFDFI